jgi:lysophospholipase L1-like esterase
MRRPSARPLPVALLLGAALTAPGPHPARAVVTRVVGWGDSITYGYYDYTSQPPSNGTCWNGGIDPPETCGYVKRLNDRLNSTTYENPIWDIGVVNLGKGGEQTSEALSRVDRPYWTCPCAGLSIPCPVNSLKYWVCNGTLHDHDVFVLLEGTNDLTQQEVSLETVQFNLRQIAQKAADLGLQPLLATLTPRHRYSWFRQSGCPNGSIDAANVSAQSLDSLIVDLATTTGWPYADLFGHFWKLKDHGLLNTDYQTWQDMKCDPNHPECLASGGTCDPVGHPDRDGIDLMAFKVVGYGQIYADTIESHVKRLLPPRLIVTPPASPTTGVAADFSADLPDLGQTASLRWDFGNGDVVVATPTTSPFVQAFTYYVPGPYAVTVTALHANGGSRSVVVNIVVSGVDLTIFRDGFEAGDATAWSAVTP